MFDLELSLLILLIISILAVCAFEFINGFHDTANAVATVIYTNSLKPQQAVVLSGILNSAGVFVGGIGVAMGIIHLLPTEALLNQTVWESVGMILALLLTAILWNLGTWYFGIPCSSSHTLIGSILGVGIAFAHLPGNADVSINWSKAGEVGLSLLISPFLGLLMAGLLMFILSKLIKNKEIFETPDPEKVPPMWIRSLLIFTCAGVSFSHGSNDGQKGVGLLMLVLISILPVKYALNLETTPAQYQESIALVDTAVKKINVEDLSSADRIFVEQCKKNIADIIILMNIPQSKWDEKVVTGIRKEIFLLDKDIKKLSDKTLSGVPEQDRKNIKTRFERFKSHTTDYAPRWVIVLISLSLGIGTMIGWKKIVVTIGEKIGKSHLTYAQGASAELIATLTIGFSSFVFHLPVSTTHILSSGVAGTMVASNGLKNLQASTIKSIALAWLLTLPVCIIVSYLLFGFFRLIF